MTRTRWTIGIVLVMATLLGLALLTRQRESVSVPPPPRPPAPAPLAIWPWPHAIKDTPHEGVTHWLDTSSPDGTVLDLFDFDFGANPRLRFEIYDQDEDDAHPFDDTADCWPVGVGQATRHLNAIGRGPVLAAWHGLFFNTDFSKGGPHYLGHHVTPVVLNGKVHCNVGRARWTFGVQYDQSGHPTFKTRHEPDTQTLAREFSFAAGGAQCLIQDGKPLRLHPFPSLDEPAPPQPVPSTPQEAGYIPNVDWIKTSRATMGWSKDNRYFYLLFVKQQGTEGGGVMALHGHGPPVGGWTVSDEQRFWLSKGAWGAINSDGGDISQLTYRMPDGRYTLLLPLGDRQVYSPQFENAPQHGTLLYFYVREARY